MMKVVVALVLISLALANAQRSCLASGDPHFVTFDGLAHDFQGAGSFIAAKNSFFEVRYIARFCNPPHNTVTCINAVYVQIQSPTSGDTATVICSVATSQVNNYCMVDGVRYTWNSLTSSIPLKGSLGIFSKDIGTGTFVVSSIRASGWRVQAAQYYMVITLSETAGFFKETYGVCGFYNNIASDDFSFANGTIIQTPPAGSNRISPTNVNIWGASFAAANFPYEVTNLLSEMKLLDEPTVIPDATVQAQLDKVSFASPADYSDAVKRCESAGSTDARVIENCVYDISVLNNFLLAASNHEAANVAATSDSGSSGLNGGAVAGIVLGCVAFVSLVTALVMYVRLHKLRVEYSRALIVRSQAQGAAAGDTNGLAGNL